jgi:uncharacterized membrane protein
MNRARSLGIFLIVAGIALLLVAPRAQTCVTDFDATVCEATGMVVLKVVGLVVVLAGAIALMRHEASTRGSGDDAP